MSGHKEPISNKILNLIDAAGSTASAIHSYNKTVNGEDLATAEIMLKREKFLTDIDNNLYSASSQKALKGIESLFYGNSKTGTNGFFKDQLNDMDYELYQQGTDAMIAETLSVEYLSKNYGMTESHAQRFIDEYGSTITAEANQRTQTNTFLSMQTQLGSDMAAFTTLQANGVTSALEQYQNIVKHYNDIGGSSWDITGTYNPDKLENKLSFGYNWSISASKRIVDANLGKNGITTEQIVENAMSIYDTSMADMGDGSHLSNATIQSNREQFENSIRTYISARSGQLYTESQDKARNLSNAYSSIILSGGYVDDAKFDELIADTGLSKDNAYDLSFILEINKTRLASSSSSYGSGSSGYNNSESNLAINNFYSNFYMNYQKTPDDCNAEIARMESSGQIDIIQGSKLREEVKNRNTFAIENYSLVESTVKDYLGLDANNKNLLIEVNNNPSFKNQIIRTLASHPEWDSDQVFKYGQQIAIDMQSDEIGKNIDNMLEIKFGDATGYSTEYNINTDNESQFMQDIYSGKYAYLLRPKYSEEIASSITRGVFSDEDKLEEAISQKMFGKLYTELSAHEKNVLQVNIAYHSINAKKFSTLTSVLDNLGKGNQDYRMVDIYGFGAGAISGNLAYFIDNSGYMNIGMFEVGDSNWESVHDNDGSYGIQIDASILKGMKRVNIQANLERLGVEKNSIPENPNNEKDEINPFGPMMQQVNTQIKNESEKDTTLASQVSQVKENYVDPRDAWGLEQEEKVFTGALSNIKIYGINKGAVDERR